MFENHWKLVDKVYVPNRGVGCDYFLRGSVARLAHPEPRTTSPRLSSGLVSCAFLSLSSFLLPLPFYLKPLFFKLSLCPDRFCRFPGSNFQIQFNFSFFEPILPNTRQTYIKKVDLLSIDLLLYFEFHFSLKLMKNQK